MRIIITAALLLAGACAAAFAAAPTATTKANLPVVLGHLDRVGDKFTIRNAKGRETIVRVVEVAKGVTTWRRDDNGCRFSRHTEGFGPSLAWRGCGGADGSTTVKRTGSVFPMRIGASEMWDYRSRNVEGNEWWSMRRCDVKDYARVTVPAGSFDAYRVVCEDNWSVAEFFYAPSVRRYVRFRKTWKQPGLGANQDDQLVAFTPAK